jgi:hypothetical protein
VEWDVSSGSGDALKMRSSSLGTWLLGFSHVRGAGRRSYRYDDVFFVRAKGTSALCC